MAFGFVYDSTGSYEAILAMGVPISTLTIVLVGFLSPYKEKARGGPISQT